MTQIHDDKTRMDRDIALIEPDPYNGEKVDTVEEFRWRSKSEVEEWVYEQAYECENIEEFHQIAPNEVYEEVGRAYVDDGKQAAKNVYREYISEAVRIKTTEELSNYVDGQMRLFAGYNVARNGDTLSEGDYSVWQDLRLYWERGVLDKLKGNEKYHSIK